jgi:hypothetical protein
LGCQRLGHKCHQCRNAAQQPSQHHQLKPNYTAVLVGQGSKSGGLNQSNILGNILILLPKWYGSLKGIRKATIRVIALLLHLVPFRLLPLYLFQLRHHMCLTTLLCCQPLAFLPDGMTVDQGPPGRKVRTDFVVPAIAPL